MKTDKNNNSTEEDNTKKAIENHIDYLRKEVDPRSNEDTTPPQDEEIRIPALWVFEVYTPRYISNFHDGVKNLGWSNDNWSISSDFQDTLNELRYRASGSGWINLGYVVDKNQKPSWPGTRKAELPDGIKSIRASILQYLPSTTILACEFIFKDDLASSIENPLRDTYSAYEEKIEGGYTIHDVSHQKKDAVILIREYLKNLCTSWIAENLPGLFSSGYFDGNFPVCELITFKKHAPYQEIDGKRRDTFLSMLNLDNNFDAWKSDELKGLFLQLPDGRDNQINNLVLSGNIEDILVDKDLKGYGSTKNDQILNYLSYIDHTFGKWVLLVLAKTFEKKLAKLRDSYGEIDIDNIDVSTSILLNLDRQILDFQKNVISFIPELKDFCNNKSDFMYDVFEFNAIHNMRKSEYGLFESFRNNLLFYADLLARNENLLRNTADANRQIATAKSSTYLAQTNLGLQKRMNRMTLVMLLFTLITTLYAILEINKVFDLTSVVDWLVSFFQSIMNQFEK